MTGTVRTAVESNIATAAGEPVERPMSSTVLERPGAQELPHLGSDLYVRRRGDTDAARELFAKRIGTALPDGRLREIANLQQQARAQGLDVPVLLSDGEQRAVRSAVQELFLGLPRETLAAQARDRVGRWTRLLTEPTRPAGTGATQPSAESSEDFMTVALSPSGTRMRIAGGAGEAFTGTRLSASRSGITPVLNAGMNLRSGAATTASFGAQYRDGKLAAQVGAATPLPLVASHFRITMDLAAAAGSASLTHAFGPHDGEIYAMRNGDGSAQMGARLVMNLGAGNRRGASFALVRDTGHVDGTPPRTGLTATYVLMF